jgi:hypothetical protein
MGQNEQNSIFSSVNDISENNSKSFLRNVIIGLVFIVPLILGIIYYLIPKHGDLVNAPAGLEHRIRQHFANEGRGVSSLTYYYCTSFGFENEEIKKTGYSVIVKLDERKLNLDKPSDYLEGLRIWKLHSFENQINNENGVASNDWKIFPFSYINTGANSEKDPCNYNGN